MALRLVEEVGRDFLFKTNHFMKFIGQFSTYFNDRFVCFDSLHSSQQFFSHVGMGLPWLNQYTKQQIKCFVQRHNTMTPLAVRL